MVLNDLVDFSPQLLLSNGLIIDLTDLLIRRDLVFFLKTFLDELKIFSDVRIDINVLNLQILEEFLI